MNVQTFIKQGLIIGGKTALRLIEIGIWGTLNQYTSTQFRDNSARFNREIEQHVENKAVELRLIKRDEK